MNKIKGGVNLGIGYTLGCLVSIMLWNFQRQKVFKLTDNYCCRFIRIKAARYVVYLLIILTAVGLTAKYGNGEIVNFITAFLVIDISTSERENINIKDVKFHKTISIVCKSLVCGFCAPLFYILIFGNYFAVLYFMLYNLCCCSEYEIFEIVLNILTIIPAFIVQVILYLIYIFTSKKYTMDFKGDYIVNSLKKPLLNIEIMAAYIEAVGFYYHIYENDTSYIKIYGEEKSKVEEIQVKHYLGVIYIAAFFMFLGFMSVYLI